MELALAMLLSTFAVGLLLPALYLLVETAAAALFRCPPHRTLETSVQQRAGWGDVAVLVPAHNESSNLAATLGAVKAQLRQQDRLLVVADNCTDDTAALARGCGAQVTERTDASRRGKGFALDHGLRLLALEPPACVIMIDADCRVGDRAILLLAQHALATGRPVQASYLMVPGENSSLGERIATFAWRIKNHVRPSGSRALGLPCLLTGSGMAFPWHVLLNAPLASGNIVEDMQLGVDLACRGHLPTFLPEAVVTSQFAARSAAREGQRRRWEHGHLSTLLSQTPRLVAASIRLRRMRLLALALELSVPPLALFLVLLSALLTACLVWAITAGDVFPLLLAAAALAIFSVSILLGWRLAGADLLSATDLLGVPAYVWRKLPIYFSFLSRRESAWVRTERDRNDPQ